MDSKELKKELAKAVEAIGVPVELHPVPGKRGCENGIEAVNTILEKRKDLNQNDLKKCGSEESGCGCSKSDGDTKGKKTDLVVLIDTSGSMNSPSRVVSEAVEEAIAAARKTCEPDLRILFLGLEKPMPGTIFTQSHRDYLMSLHGSSIVLAANQGHVGNIYEQGANGVEDLSKYMDWREGACRSIFYISDEKLDSINPTNTIANDTAATQAAIKMANENNVTVFSHHLERARVGAEFVQNYRDLCEETGGELFLSAAPNVKEYVNILSKAICNACGKPKCKEVDFPEIEPCINISWGQSDCDCIESSDYEVMTLTVCNCYSNTIFENFKITAIQITDKNGKPVPSLPNGKPSVQLLPIGPYCFGNIGPCSCVSREFVLINEGAKAGDYKVQLHGICFDVSRNITKEVECFGVTICKD